MADLNRRPPCIDLLDPTNNHRLRDATDEDNLRVRSLLAPKGDDHLPVSIPGVIFLWTTRNGDVHTKSMSSGHTRDSGTQSQIPAGSIWLFLRSTCMPNLKRRVANSSCFEARNGVLARKKHVFGVVLATRERNRKSQPAHRDRFLVDPHTEFEALGPRL